MPEAIARFDQDDMLVAPRPRRRASKKTKRSSGWFAFVRRQPGRVFVTALGGAVLIGIVGNATLMQNARHPAPLLFGLAPSRPSQAPASPPAPAPRPVDLAAAPAAPAAVAPMQKPAPSTPHASLDASPSPHKDAIAALLRNEAPSAEPASRAAAVRHGLVKGDAAADASPRVAAAQRALMRVGFVVRPNGLLGADTRQAIERFEKDRGLTVTGALSARTLKELSARSGVAIP